ncbi:MAG: hypothetical protein KAQ64_01005 [Candidatus Pacebacteria bacterium]|nr:hypothetical protein [Candidatus Paceibacterota bacterium]
MKNNKAIILVLLLITVLSFSGCSIRKAEEETENKAPEIKENKEIKIIDTDGDGLKDEEEKVLGTDIDKFDTDDDGLNDFEEVKKWKTDPLKADTDGDGYLDGQEVEGGYDPLGSEQLDSDNDGLGDADEKKIGTDPEKFDTDGDGLSDKEEIDAGRDPLIAE